MRRYGSRLDLPERLLRLRVEEWPEPGPQPLWWEDRGSDTWVLREARLRWQRARMEWVRDHGRTAPVVAMLFGRGFDPASDDPRAGVRERRRLERTLLPREEWTAVAFSEAA